ncbi:MAG: YfhO family protein, partial [bacterium]|nr:YfhO family protein [bacterium]
ELAGHGVLLLVVLAVLFPGVLRGEAAMPGTILYEIDPWRQHAPVDFAPALNNTTLENLTQFAPWYALQKRAAQAGEWPVWNHLQYTGMPLLANFQSAPFYPPHLLHMSFLDVPVAMTIYLLLRLWLCGFAAYLYGRFIRLDRLPAAFLSVAWMLSGFNVLWSYWQLPDVTCWLPIFLIGLELILNRRYRSGFFTTALAATLLLLAGHPETAFAMCLMAGLYFFIRLALLRPRGQHLWMPLVAAGGAWALALTVCAAQIVPFLEYVRHSYTWAFRADPDTHKYFVPTQAFVALWVPRFFGATPDGIFWSDRNSNYVGLIYAGIAVWMGMGLLLTKGKWDRIDRHRAIAFAIPGGLALLLALGVPPFSSLSRLPLFSSMRGLYHGVFAMFALPAMAAIGLQRWCSDLGRPFRLLRLAIPAIPVALAVGWLYSLHHGWLAMKGWSGYLGWQIAVAVGLVAACVAILIVGSMAQRPKLVAAGFLVVLLGDLMYQAHDYLPTAPRDQVFPDTDLTRFLQDQDHPTRTVVGATPIAHGLLSIYGIEQLWGYDGIFPLRIMRFFHECHPNAWAIAEPLCSNEFYLHPPGVLPKDDPDSQFEYVTTVDNIDVNRNRSALPRAFLVGEVEACPDEEALFARLTSGLVDFRRTVLTESPPDGVLPALPGTQSGAARIEERRSTSVRISVDAKQPCALVMTDAFYPGWRAVLDGERELEIFPADYAFRGVLIPEGSHTVEFVYRPTSLRVGLVTSCVALGGSLLFCAWALLKSRGRDRGSAPREAA